MSDCRWCCELVASALSRQWRTTLNHHPPVHYRVFRVNQCIWLLLGRSHSYARVCAVFPGTPQHTLCLPVRSARTRGQISTPLTQWCAFQQVSPQPWRLVLLIGLRVRKYVALASASPVPAYSVGSSWVEGRSRDWCPHLQLSLC